MSNDKILISNFVKNIFEDNYAEAKEMLQSAVIEKIKMKMKDDVVAVSNDTKGE